jgi:hypothetical protein
MKKAILAVLSAILVITTVQPVQANDQRVLAIIDNAINSNNFPQIIYEACFTFDSCPNGAREMEGPGAAQATGWLMDSQGPNAKQISLISAWPKSMNSLAYHGDAMVKSALTVDPNLKIVFIRISNFGGGNTEWVTKDGKKMPPVEAGGFHTHPDYLVRAIDWVSKNASKYSIDAISISQSSVTVDNLKRCSTDTTTINAVASLNAANIPVFVATGNDRRRDVVGFPSCVNGAIGVGALGNVNLKIPQLEPLTNTGPGLDMVAPGTVSITKYNGSTISMTGSSVATAVSAAAYVNRNISKTFGEYLNSLPKISIGTASYIHTRN